MSGWASLSGYLHLKPGGGGLNILKTRKKLWCILEESQGKLLYYKNKEDAKSKPPLGFVELKGAAITLDMDTQNQFVIIVEGREIQLTAENHESMMIWMMALQARRDQFALANKTSQDTDDHTDPFDSPGGDATGSRERSASDLSVLRDYQARGNPDPSRLSPHKPLEATKSLHSQYQSLTPGQPNYKTLPKDWKKNPLHRMGVTIDGGHPSLKSVFEKDRSRSLPPLLEDSPLSLLQAGSKQQSVSMEMNDVLQLVEHQQNGKPLVGPKPPVANGSFLFWSSSSPGTDTSDDHGHGLDFGKHRVLGRSISARVGDEFSTNPMTSSQYSDSALSASDAQSGERISVLEQELIATKCELAKVMNRQTCFQEILKQKDEIIEDLDGKLCNKTPNSDGYDSKKRTSPSSKENQERVRILQNQNRFLNEEVRRLAKLRFHEHGVIRSQDSNILGLEANIEVWKLEYVSLIQSSIRFTGTDTMDDAELSLFGGDRHKDRIVSLLEDARRLNPSLPTYEYLATGEVHVDCFGFKHQFTDEGLLLHYLCQELSQHYLSQANSYEKHQKHWSLYLKNNAKNVLADRKELKDLVRGGIPEPYRKLMWKAFVLHQVEEIIKDKGAHYYRSLCNSVPDSPLAARYRKQISLDLMRTMPSNVKFSTPGSKGIMDLQDVLLAFCLHNPQVGYCQGMNFLVAMALLFLDAQDAFWTLVAVTERYHSPSYFDHNLLGAQADQSVLHDLMKEKLPTLAKHLNSIEIEISTVTLNWFLALFFDAVPFQTLLRIWDCFLLEGPKVLFRFSLAILHLHSKEIIKKTDTISVMRHLKACARISYDSDGLIQVSFKTLKPFPRRQDIVSKQTFYLNALKEKYHQREMQRVAFLEMDGTDSANEAITCPDSFECCTVAAPGYAWVAYGDDASGSKVCVVDCRQQTMTDTAINLDTRILAMTYVPDDCVLFGTLSSFVYACCQDTREVKWHYRVHDAVLSLKLYQDDEEVDEEGGSSNRLFAGLADGTVAVFETVTLACKVYDIIYIPIGQSPVTCLQVIGNQLWCACGNSISVIHASTLDPMDRFCVSTNPYDTVLSLVPGLPGVWISVRGSSVLELWDPLTLSCKLLYDIRSGKNPVSRKEDDTHINSSRITSILALDHSVWIGTGEGTLMTYDVFTKSKTDTESPSFMTDGMLSVDSYSQSWATSSSERGRTSHLTADQENYARLKEVERRVKDLYLQRLVGDGYLRKKAVKDGSGSMDEEDNDTETEERKCLILDREERETRKKRRKAGGGSGAVEGEVGSLKAGKKSGSLLDKVRGEKSASVNPDAKYKTMSKDERGTAKLARPKSLTKTDKLLNAVAGKSGVRLRKGSFNDESVDNNTTEDNDVLNSNHSEEIGASISCDQMSSRNTSTSSNHFLDKTLCEGDDNDSNAEDQEKSTAPHRSYVTQPPPPHPTVYYLFKNDVDNCEKRKDASAINTSSDLTAGKGKDIGQRSAKKSVDSGVSSLAEKSADNSEVCCDNTVSLKTNRVDSVEGTSLSGMEEAQKSVSSSAIPIEKERNGVADEKPSNVQSCSKMKDSHASGSSMECAVNMSSSFYSDDKSAANNRDLGSTRNTKSWTSSSIHSKSRSLSEDSNKTSEFDEVFSDTIVCSDTLSHSISDCNEIADSLSSNQDLAMNNNANNERLVSPKDESYANGHILPPSSNETEQEENDKNIHRKPNSSKSAIRDMFEKINKSKIENSNGFISSQNGGFTSYAITEHLPKKIKDDCELNGDIHYCTDSTINDISNTKVEGDADEEINTSKSASTEPAGVVKTLDNNETSVAQGKLGSITMTNGITGPSSSSEEESFGDFVGQTAVKADNATDNSDGVKIDTCTEENTAIQASVKTNRENVESKVNGRSDISDSSDEVSSIADSSSTDLTSPDPGISEVPKCLPSVKDLRAKFESNASPTEVGPKLPTAYQKSEDGVIDKSRQIPRQSPTEPSPYNKFQIKNTHQKLCRLSSSGLSENLAHESCSSVSSTIERVPESPKRLVSPKSKTDPSRDKMILTTTSSGKLKLRKQSPIPEKDGPDVVDTKFYGDSDEDLSVHEARVKSFKNSYAALSERRISLTNSGKFAPKGDLPSPEVDQTNKSQSYPAHRTLRQHDDPLPGGRVPRFKDDHPESEAYKQDDPNFTVDAFSNLSSISRKAPMRRQSSEQSSVCDNILPRDTDTQWRLDYTNLHVETDMESVGTSVEDQSTADTSPGRRLSGLSSSTELQDQRIHEFLRDTASSLSAQFGDIEDEAASFLPTPTVSGCNSTCWSSYDEISTPSQCDADGARPSHVESRFPRSSTQSVASRGTSVASTIDIYYNADLSLLSKNKVSDKPVTWLLNTELGGNPIVISLAGSHSGDEAVLIWTRELNETLWTNCPAYEYNPKTKTSRLPAYMRQHLSSTSSSRSSPRQRLPSVNSN